MSAFALSYASAYGAAGHLPENEESDFPGQSVTISRLQQVTSMRRPQQIDETFNTLEIAHKLKLRNRHSASFNDRATVPSLVSIGDDDELQRHNITDILSLSVKDQETYKLIDRCVYQITTRWNPSVIADKSTLDIESELMENLPEDYDALFDHFYNSSDEICSVLHKVASKIVIKYIQIYTHCTVYTCTYIYSIQCGC